MTSDIESVVVVTEYKRAKGEQVMRWVGIAVITVGLVAFWTVVVVAAEPEPTTVGKALLFAMPALLTVTLAGLAARNASGADGVSQADLEARLERNRTALVAALIDLHSSTHAQSTRTAATAATEKIIAASKTESQLVKVGEPVLT